MGKVDKPSSPVDTIVPSACVGLAAFSRQGQVHPDPSTSFPEVDLPDVLPARPHVAGLFSDIGLHPLSARMVVPWLPLTSPSSIPTKASASALVQVMRVLHHLS